MADDEGDRPIGSYSVRMENAAGSGRSVVVSAPGISAAKAKALEQAPEFPRFVSITKLADHVE